MFCFKDSLQNRKSQEIFLKNATNICEKSENIKKEDLQSDAISALCVKIDKRNKKQKGGRLNDKKAF